MNKPPRTILLVFLFGAATWAQLVGDFAPLQVGNEWKYSKTAGGIVSACITGHYDTTTRTVKIVYRIDKADTIEYTASVVDSIRRDVVCPASQRRIVDTVVTEEFKVLEMKDGRLVPDPNFSHSQWINYYDGMLMHFFSNRFRNQSALNEERIGPTVYQVFDSTFSSPGAYFINSKTIKDIGLYFFSGKSTGIGARPSLYNLVEFNGIRFPPGVSIRSRVRPKNGKDLHIAVFLKLGRDLNGRRVLSEK
jgi:hypothetical protein